MMHFVGSYFSPKPQPLRRHEVRMTLLQLDLLSQTNYDAAHNHSVVFQWSKRLVISVVDELLTC